MGAEMPKQLPGTVWVEGVHTAPAPPPTRDAEVSPRPPNTVPLPTAAHRRRGGRAAWVAVALGLGILALLTGIVLLAGALVLISWTL